MLRDINDNWNDDLADSVIEIFKNLNKNNFRTIIVLEHYDKAATLFDSNAKYQVFREIMHKPHKYNLRCIILTRIAFEAIEHRYNAGSTFGGVVEQINLLQNENFLLDFYNILEKDYKIILNHEQKEQIKYYSGGIPILISLFGQKIIENTPNINIKEIFNSTIDFLDYYKKCRDYLKDYRSEKEENSLSYLHKLYAFIYGPNIGVCDNDLKWLKAAGYLSDGDESFVAISKYFSEEFLRHESLKHSLWDGITSLERQLRDLIVLKIKDLIKAKNISGDSFDEIIEKIFRESDVTEKELSKLYPKFQMSNQQKFGKAGTLLEVSSFSALVKTILGNWDCFKEYFNGSKEDWQEKLKLCVKARDPLAHSNPEFLTAGEQVFAKEYCTDILAKLPKNIIKPSHEEIEEIIELARKKHTIHDSNSVKTIKPVKELCGKEGDFIVLDVGKNIQGIICIDGKNYKATVPKNKMPMEMPKSNDQKKQ